ncbi:MAG: mannose-1-phosphate guanylyltransferase/mannose-6-phosphate isomerase [Thiotrichales bacterium]|nr:mannose-1-phosphate guanylyltransferase/mannose-6-phosphate isomerase [Thiotrichales bacterium]
MINLILCGGSGTRLWPISREHAPKQFVPLFDDESLFQKTVKRNQPLCDQFLIVLNEALYFLARDQIQALSLDPSPKRHFLLEPCSRNTAPAIALACLGLEPNQLVLVTPSDHLITNQVAYEVAVNSAKTLAKQNQLVTFGTQPTYPETAFGYIETNGADVLSFTEKPNSTTAERYLEQGHYVWNSGLFCFKAGVFLEELKQHAPDIYHACVSAHKTIQKTANSDYQRVTTEAMQAIPTNSIDYAVMEKSPLIKVISAEMGWRDLGSFEGLCDILPQDKRGNTSQDNMVLLNAHNNLILSEQRMVSLVDVDNLMVIDTADALLIAPKGSGQNIKQVVDILKQRGSDLPYHHRTVHRPWGTYTILESGKRYKIKRIEVQPGKSLSLQTHQYRSEHWIVISGTATVTIGTQTNAVLPNESTYIPIGEKHRLANFEAEPLILIEAQVGDIISETDIERFSEY